MQERTEFKQCQQGRTWLFGKTSGLNASSTTVYINSYVLACQGEGLTTATDYVPVKIKKDTLNGTDLYLFTQVADSWILDLWLLPFVVF